LRMSGRVFPEQGISRRLGSHRLGLASRAGLEAAHRARGGGLSTESTGAGEDCGWSTNVQRRRRESPARPGPGREPTGPLRLTRAPGRHGPLPRRGKEAHPPARPSRAALAHEAASARAGLGGGSPRCGLGAGLVDRVSAMSPFWPSFPRSAAREGQIRLLVDASRGSSARTASGLRYGEEGVVGYSPVGVWSRKSRGST
jgi:hypothetical protein